MSDFEQYPLVDSVRMIPIDSIEANAWNPNEMDDETFNRLAEEIETVGMVEPIQLVPLDTGKFRIIGGEHRYRVTVALGEESIPAVLLTDERFTDEDLQRFMTTRLNAIRGQINPEKFIKLYEDLHSRYEEESLQALMGFTDSDAWDDLTKDIRTNLKDLGIQKEVLDKFTEATKELKTVDDLTVVLNKIFTEHGDTLERNFLWFSFGGKEHLYIDCKKPLWKEISRFANIVSAKGADMSLAFAALMDGWENRFDVPVEDKSEEAEGG